MRELKTEPQIRKRKRARKRKKSGCGGCLLRIIVVATVFYAFACGGYKLFVDAGIKNRILQAQYPIKYEEIVEKYASEYKLEKAFVYAVIRTESRFDPYAVSSASARGLMQIREETGKDCAKELKIKDYTPDMLFDADTNIRLGCYYLSKLMKLYGNNISKTAAAYNAGLGNVNNWLSEEKYIDKEGDLTNIPFAETRNYVDGVIKSRQIYIELYFSAD